MILPVDLHIHSCLSPCADDDMTPHNITAMAGLKGLAAIAVCDHNACLNARACAEAGERNGVLVVPGVEATTAEELHALCYFADLDALEDFCALLERLSPHVPNKPELFGNQLIYDAQDEPVGECDRWLGAAAQLSLEDMEAEALKRGGVLVPSHINRQAQSLLANLGFIPETLRTRTLEVVGDYALPQGYRTLHSSDAHNLGMILEEGFPLDVLERSVRSIVAALRSTVRM